MSTGAVERLRADDIVDRYASDKAMTLGDLREAVRKLEAERDALLAKVEADRTLIEEAAQRVQSHMLIASTKDERDDLRRLHARLTARLNKDGTDNG